MNNMEQVLILKLVRLVLKKPMIIGLERVNQATPAIFVANHLGSYGPITLMVFLPFRLIPWVTHRITDYRLCPKYILQDFIVSELKLKPPLGNILASLIGPCCVLLMKYLKAIPVYKKSSKLRLTFAQSLSELKKGNNLLIFPEISVPARIASNSALNVFDSGFIDIARVFFEETTKIIDFYPVAVNKTKKIIMIGERVSFDTNNPSRFERERIIKRLRESILHMYYSNEEPKA